MSLAAEWKELSPRAVRGKPRRGNEETCRKPEREETCRKTQRTAKPRSTRSVFTCFVAVAVAFSGLLIFSVCLHVEVVQNEVKAREAERLIELERRQQEGLRVEIAALESPSRIEEIAVEDLQMVQASMAEYLETPAYQAAKIKGREMFSDEDAVFSDAAKGRR